MLIHLNVFINYNIIVVNKLNILYISMQIFNKKILVMKKKCEKKNKRLKY